MAYVIKRNKVKTFDFQIEGSKKVYHVPVLSALPVSTLMKARDLKDIDDDAERAEKTYDFFYDIFRDEVPEVLDILIPDDLRDLFAAYAEASNTPAASAGE